MSRLTLILAALASLQAAADDDARTIVEAADRARNPERPFRQTLTLVDYSHGKERDRVVLTVFARLDGSTRQFKNLVRYADPPRDAGKLVLLDASKMWFYDPASKTSVRISPQQRLTGQASDGDVLTVNLAHDFTPRIIGEETIQDADRKPTRAWHLELTAATSDAMYSRLEYWVSRDTYEAIKGKFYSDSGRLLKIAYYRKFATVLGALRPTETVIIDAVDSNLVTTVTATDTLEKEIPEAWFQRDYLPRMDAE